MKAGILSAPTPSGDLREVHFEAVGDCAWFLFQPSDEEEWVGVFGRGRSPHHGVVCHASGEAFVLAGGRGYLINTGEKSLLHATDRRQEFVDVIAGPEQGEFVVADDRYLYGYGSNGQLWRTQRISWDGIRSLVLEGCRVTGEAWTYHPYSWHEFVLDLRSGRVTGATYDGPDAHDL